MPALLGTFLKKNFLYILIGFFFCSSILVGAIDQKLVFRWFTFTLHTTSLILVILTYVKDRHVQIKLNRKTVLHETVLGFSVVTIVLIFNLMYITTLPFVSLGDEVRDGGLDARSIFQGRLTNIFSFGRYDAHGLIIPAITSMFYFFFGNSVLTYRLPSALLSTVDVAIVYLLIRTIFGRREAILGSLILATQPIHMLYARTQVVFGFSFFWTAVILGSLYSLYKRNKLIDFMAFGTILGFASAFHASIRVLTLLLLVVVVAIQVKKTVIAVAKKNTYSSYLFSIVLVIVFFIVGYGPRIIYTNATNFFHTSRLSVGTARQTEKVDVINTFKALERNYTQSLFVWIYNPTYSYTYISTQPLFKSFFSLLFLLGIGYCLFIRKSIFLSSLIFLTFALPFLSSAITETINLDYRLSPFLAIGAILIAAGVHYIYSIVPNRFIQYSFNCLITVFIFLQVINFFNEEPINSKLETADYLSMHLVTVLQKKVIPGSGNDICISVSNRNNEKYKLLHFREQYEYFLPEYNIHTQENPSMSDNEAYINRSICSVEHKPSQNVYTVSCANDSDYRCPPDYTGNFRILF